jgi:hypothetical protein
MILTKQQEPWEYLALRVDQKLISKLLEMHWNEWHCMTMSGKTCRHITNAFTVRWPEEVIHNNLLPQQTQLLKDLF